MLRKKFIIPMVAIMSVASSATVFASEKTVNENNTAVIYKEAEVTAKSGLNVRKNPAIEKDNKISAVPKGTELGIVGQENDWYKVKLNNDKNAYINSNYVKVTNNDLYVKVDRLNFREAPGMDKKIYDVLTKGTKVEFIKESGYWVQVKVNNTTGYVHSKYITHEKPVVNEETVVKPTKKPQSNSANETTTNKKPIEDKVDKEETKPTENTNKVDKVDKEETKKPEVNKPESTKPSTPKPESSKPSQKPESSKPSEKPEENKPSESNDVQAVIDLAYAQIGKPYNWGSEGPNSFDCSGLMRYIFEKGAGVNLPRTSKAQSQYGTTVSRSNLKPGDLIFSSTDGSGTVSHVGVYVGGGQMIHAPKPGDVVKKSSINSSYWNDAYLWAKRVM